MRLTPRQVQAIKQATAEVFGEMAQVWLFGSRADDSKRGGDIDLLIRPPAHNGKRADGKQAYSKQILMEKIRLLSWLEQRLDERRIDIVIEAPDDTRPIVRIAHRQGILL